MRCWMVESCRFASVVMVAKVWRISPSGDFHASHIPPENDRIAVDTGHTKRCLASGIVAPLVEGRRAHETAALRQGGAEHS